MREKNIVKAMRHLILTSYGLIQDFPRGDGPCHADLEQWLQAAERWNEDVQIVSNRIAYLSNHEVEMLHGAKHFHTPVYIALSEKANVIFAAWFQAQAKIYDQDQRYRKREAAWV